MMGLASYEIVGSGGEWRVRHDGRADNVYQTKESAFEAAIVASSLALRHEKTFAERLTEEVELFREAAAKAAAGTPRELLLKRVRQAEIALHVNDWLKSPGLQPPRGDKTPG
jgi:hypothetical protein